MVGRYRFTATMPMLRDAQYLAFNGFRSVSGSSHCLWTTGTGTG
jgi:hypothetical protein